LDAEVWHGQVAGVTAGQAYGFRFDGPWDPAAGLLCNPGKVVLDPYARAISGAARFGPAIYSQDVDNPARTTRPPGGRVDAGRRYAGISRDLIALRRAHPVLRRRNYPAILMPSGSSPRPASR